MTVSPSFQPLAVAVAFDDHDPVLAEVGDRTLRDLEVHDLLGGGRVDRGEGRVRVVEAGLAPAAGRDLVHALDALDRSDARTG